MGRGSGRGGESGLVFCGSVCFFILMVISAGLVGGSFKIVEPLEYGIAFNTLSKDLVTGRVYTSGRYFLGLTNDFIKYPRTRRTIGFGTSGSDAASLPVRIAQGEVSLQASLQYSLNVTTLVTLYRAFGTNYHSRFVSIAQFTIIAALSTGFNISDFYANRGAVIASVTAALRSAFAANNAVMHEFQMRELALPAANEAQIIQKLISEQRAQTAENVQSQQGIAAQITVVQGTTDQTIALYNANQTQIASVITQTADATARKTQLVAASGAYALLRSRLNFTNPDLLRYLYLKNLRTLPPAATLAVGFNNVNAMVQNL